MTDIAKLFEDVEQSVLDAEKVENSVSTALETAEQITALAAITGAVATAKAEQAIIENESEVSWLKTQMTELRKQVEGLQTFLMAPKTEAMTEAEEPLILPPSPSQEPVEAVEAETMEAPEPEQEQEPEGDAEDLQEAATPAPIAGAAEAAREVVRKLRRLI